MRAGPAPRNRPAGDLLWRWMGKMLAERDDEWRASLEGLLQPALDGETCQPCARTNLLPMSPDRTPRQGCPARSELEETQAERRSSRRRALSAAAAERSPRLDDRVPCEPGRHCPREPPNRDSPRRTAALSLPRPDDLRRCRRKRADPALEEPRSRSGTSRSGRIATPTAERIGSRHRARSQRSQ